MENNYIFWEEYLKKIKRKISDICNRKDNVYIDFHIHTNYSSDGKQNIKDILRETKKAGFDFISITDHDTLNAYDEIYDVVKNDLTEPIIIPGIEFTIDNFNYGNQCHILQLFINPKDPKLIRKVQTNKKASFNRSKIQFRRLKENRAIQEIIKDNTIDISYIEYIDYLEKNQFSPEYDTISNYLMKKFQEKNITTFNILKLLEKYNEYDCYDDRKSLKSNRLKKLRERYNYEEKNFFNVRFLQSMLAIKEVDDDWWPPPSSGSLSVNSYGQLKLNELYKKEMTFWAHPTETKLNIVDNYISCNKNIIGVEKNIRNKYTNEENLDSLLLKRNLYKIIGSDNHGNKNDYYANMDFFIINSQIIKNIIFWGDKNGKN